MSCNAYNHPPGCNCNFRGGNSSLGSRRFIAKSISTNKHNRSYLWYEDIYRSSITFPTDCYWCNKKVFFHRSLNGGSVLFDKLGAPWKIHPCWQEHQKRNFAERDMCSRYEIISNNYNYLSRQKSNHKLINLQGCIYKVLPQLLTAKESNLVEFIFSDQSGSKINVLISKLFFDEIKTYAMLSMAGFKGNYRSNSYFIPINIKAESPEVEPIFYLPSFKLKQCS